ncbi:hypothetical protein CRX72_17435 [Pantoea sp. BRM17]|nr:hypothetical protein CRX72_17435 [Pantoea sp. BRM17]
MTDFSQRTAQLLQHAGADFTGPGAIFQRNTGGQRQRPQPGADGTNIAVGGRLRRANGPLGFIGKQNLAPQAMRRRLRQRIVKLCGTERNRLRGRKQP